MNNKIIAAQILKIAKSLVSNQPLIDAFTFNKISKTSIPTAERIAQREMPNSKFAFLGVDKDYIYFNVVCHLEKTNNNEIRDIIAKTPFEVIEESKSPVYIAKFRMSF